MVNHVALVCYDPDNKNIGFRQLAIVSAALQKQVSRDFGPIWGIQATVDPFQSLDDVPLGYWPIVIADNINIPGAAGVHEDRMGQPFSLVQSGPLWSLTASHECLEMFADPFGDRTVGGYAPKMNTPTRVEFLVEVCDPCEDPSCAYAIDGVPVSDFYTPHYFDLFTSPGVRYDFTGCIHAPLTVLNNGYLSWHAPSPESEKDNWWQLREFGPDKGIPVPLKLPSRKKDNTRTVIDEYTAQLRGTGPLGMSGRSKRNSPHVTGTGPLGMRGRAKSSDPPVTGTGTLGMPTLTPAGKTAFDGPLGVGGFHSFRDLLRDALYKGRLLSKDGGEMRKHLDDGGTAIGELLADGGGPLGMPSAELLSHDPALKHDAEAFRVTLRKILGGK